MIECYVIPAARYRVLLFNSVAAWPVHFEEVSDRGDAEGWRESSIDMPAITAIPLTDSEERSAFCVPIL